MAINNDFYEIFNSEDIFICCQNLENFINELSTIRNRKGILRYFKNQIIQYFEAIDFQTILMGEYYYKICYSNLKAIHNYCALILEKECYKNVPENDISFLKVLLNDMQMLKNNSERLINQKFINDFFEYMDNTQSLSKKMKNININVLNYLHPNKNGFTTNHYSRIASPNVVLYCPQNNIAPEYIFLHELGHAIHYIYNINKNTNNLPACFINILNKTPNYTNFENIPLLSRFEVFADVVSLGMVYNTPYLRYHILANRIQKNELQEWNNVFNEIMTDL